VYLLTVILFLLVCPSASVAIEALRSHQNLTSLALIGKWWVFWSVGVRLFIAGVRQVLQPRFTAEEIFNIREPHAFPLVREIGFGNLSMGALALFSIARADWIVPAAIVGGLYYGLAALGHVPSKNKNAKEYTAMISDVFAALVLIGFATKSLL
jgi:hypothetical protein